MRSVADVLVPSSHDAPSPARVLSLLEHPWAWAYAIAAGLRERTVTPAVAGLVAGYVILTAVVAAGVAALVAGTPLALTTLMTGGPGT